MKKFFVTALVLIVVGLVAWMLAGTTPQAPLTARVLYETNLFRGEPRFAVALTNVTRRRVVYWNKRGLQPGDITPRSAPDMPVSGCEWWLRAHAGTCCPVTPTPGYCRQTVIEYHVISLRDELSWRIPEWSWLQRLVLPRNSMPNTNGMITIDLPAE